MLISDIYSFIFYIYSIFLGRLNLETAREVIESLISSKNAEWVGSEKAVATIYWRKPEEWATMIYDWVCFFPSFPFSPLHSPIYIHFDTDIKLPFLRYSRLTKQDKRIKF